MIQNIEFKEKVGRQNNDLIQIIQRTKINTSYSYDSKKLMDDKIKYMSEQCKSVLDFGKSSREHYELFSKGQVHTADINQYEGYPDIICDICDFSTLPKHKYDGIVCNAIIEHVYDPFSAVNNMYELLEKGGVCMCYAPFVYSYHAPKDLKFQDYFRFTRDGLALLFKDFSKVTLYSIRGHSSSAINYGFPNWKKLEKKLPFVNVMIDSLLGGKRSPLQVTGYLVWAEK